MREIKFRSWDIACSCYMEPPWKMYLNGGVSTEEVWAEVVLEQYTGLKDKNGVEIYEGDILGYGDKTTNGVVSYNGESARFETVSQGFSFPFDGGVDNLDEVIGNIHEHPEFLEA